MHKGISAWYETQPRCRKLVVRNHDIKPNRKKKKGKEKETNKAAVSRKENVAHKLYVDLGNYRQDKGFHIVQKLKCHVSYFFPTTK